MRADFQEGVNVVQSGVQLMNYESNWYSTLNVLEYFFWFKSRLHYHARVGMTPLGGNTVFVRTDVLRAVGGTLRCGVLADNERRPGSPAISAADARSAREKSGVGLWLSHSHYVPGADAAKFKKAAEDAKDNCPISRALKGNVKLSVKANLS